MASRTLDLQVDWSANSLSLLRHPGDSERMQWSTPASRDTLNADTILVPPEDNLTYMSAIDIRNVILSPAQANRLLRKPHATRQFLVFPSALSATQPPSPLHALNTVTTQPAHTPLIPLRRPRLLRRWACLPHQLASQPC